MKAIDKAWEDNLKESKEHQWKSKEEIIENLCPYDYRLKASPNCNDGEDNEICVKCWNREIEEELTFDKLYNCPIEEISLNWRSEENFKEGLRQNKEDLICIDNEEIYGVFTYEKLPVIIKYLQDVYDYATELKKNIIEYVDFNTAKEWMKQGGKAKLKNETHIIKDNDLYWIEGGYAVSLTLEEIDSKEWELVKSE